MRMLPTNEQVEYLRSLGVPEADGIPAQPPPPGPGRRRSSNRAGGSPPPSGPRRVRWPGIAAAVIVILVTLSLAGLAVGQEQASSNPARASGKDAVREAQDRARRAPAKAPIPVRVEKPPARSLERWVDFRDAILSRLEDEDSVWSTTLAEWMAWAESLEHGAGRHSAETTHSSAATKQALDELADQVAATKAATESIRKEARDREARLRKGLAAVQKDLSKNRRSLHRALIWSLTLGGLGVGAAVAAAALAARHLRRVEHLLVQLVYQNGASSVTADRMASADGGGAIPASADGDPAFGQSSCLARSQVPPDEPVPEPAEEMRSLIASAAKEPGMRITPTLPTSPCRLGLATIKGHVRSENQDYGLWFEIGGRDVLIVADGCGGSPHGKRAAYLAAARAAESVIHTYGTAALGTALPGQDAALEAIRVAAERLAVEGEKLGITQPGEGLRTTLIVVIGDGSDLGYAYIGDGGGCLVRPSGVEHFLVPQKASEDTPNVLAASLGPVMEGEPQAGSVTRRPGDLVLVGSDGVFDYVDPKSFPEDVLRGSRLFEGDLQQTAERVVGELADYREDGAVYCCDDNLTLGLLADGTMPAGEPRNQTDAEVSQEGPAGASVDADGPAESISAV